nr:MAG: capsid protein [Chemarfal virus 29]
MSHVVGTAQKTMGETSLSGSGSAPDASTTKFTDDTVGLSSEPIGEQDILGSILGGLSIGGSKTLVDYFGKPTKIASGNLSTTDSTRLKEIDVDQELLKNTSKSMKLLGNHMWRADIKVRLQVNATPFQAGRYRLFWVPSGGALTTDPGYTVFYKMHTAHLVNMTQCPGVEIDLSKQTHCELLIPFVSAYPYHDILTTGSSMGLGKLVLYPYSSLRAGSASTTAGYTIWANFENIEVSGPTVNQSGGGPGISPRGTFAAMHLSGRTKRNSAGDSQRYHRYNMPNAAQATGSAYSSNLAISSEPLLMANPGISRTTVAETSIDHIKQQFSFFETFNWTTASTADSNLKRYDHNPWSYQKSYDKGFVLSPVTFLAQHFLMFRGGMKFRFKLVKTAFHSGRLIVAYFPVYKKSTQTWAASASEYAFREIIDIRETTEFTISVPYICPEVWSESTVGFLTIDVLDPLVAPSSVDSTVPILVEVAAAEDMKFQFPMELAYRPWCPTVVQSGNDQVNEVNTETVFVPPRILGDQALACTFGEQVEDILVLARRFCANPGPSVATAARTDNVPLLVWPFLYNVTTQASAAPNALNIDTFKTDLLTKISVCYAMSTGSVRILCEPWEVDGDDIIYIGMYNNVAPTALAKSYAATSAITQADRIPWNPHVDGMYDVTVPAYQKILGRPTALQLVNSVDTTFSPTKARGSNVTFVSYFARNTASTNAFNYYWHRVAGEDYGLHYWVGTVPQVVETAT